MKEIIKYITEERLKPYLDLVDDDQNKVSDLYRKNLKYSSYMYLLLSYFEVVLRNSINNIININNVDWILNIEKLHKNIINNLKNINIKKIFEYEKFFKIQERLINTTKTSLIEDKKSITNSYLVSRLNFGFWTRLFSKNYESILWNKYLYKIFNQKVDRKEIELKLNNFRKLRNRVAHNECILNMEYDLVYYYDNIIEFLLKIDTNLVNWIEKEVSRDLFE